MFGVFIGEHDNKIDSKGRLSVPADFRRKLEEGDPEWQPDGKASMVIVYGDQRRNYAEVFRLKDMQGVYKTILQMPRGSRKRKDLERLYFQQATNATVDDTGRIVLLPRIREKLGLGSMAKVVGSGDTFLIWNPETYDDDGLDNLPDEDGYDPSYDPEVYMPGGGGVAHPGDA